MGISGSYGSDLPEVISILPGAQIIGTKDDILFRADPSLLWAASLDATVNPQGGASYTLQTPDNDGKTYLRMTNAGANTVTIPSTQTKPISIRQAGAGPTTLQAGSGVTLNGTLVFTAQHQTKTVIPLGSGIYDVVG